MLQINHLYKDYGKFHALTDVSLHIDRGEIYGFVGPNGAGKTTTMRIICGLLEATSGEVMVGGIDALTHPQDIKRLVGYVPDFFGVYDNLRVIEYMEFYGSMYGMTRLECDAIADDLLTMVNLADKKDVFVDTLSRGMKQRLCVARALLHDPQLLVLDEPNSGLDPRARFEMKEILRHLGAMGKTILISSHILPELSEMCTSIGVMEHGYLIASGRVDEIMRQSRGVRPIHIRVTSFEGMIGQTQKFKEVRKTEEIEVIDEAAEKINNRENMQDPAELVENDQAEVIAEHKHNQQYIKDSENKNVEPEENAGIFKILSHQPQVEHVTYEDGEYVVQFTGTDGDSAQLLKALVEEGICVSEFYRQKEDLESVFLEITENTDENS